MPDRMPRRRLLIVSATTLLATAGCSSADLFAGPDPLGGPPPLAHDTVVLDDVIAAEVALVSLYKSAVSGRHTGLTALLAQHEDHLSQLRARLRVPAGATASPSASASAGAPASAGASASAGAPASIARLRDAERESVASLTRRLVTVGPALAQLFASIAASDATHVAALAAL